MKINEIIVEGKPGLWANINAKRKRIKGGSGERMRKPGSKGAPTAQNFKDAASEGVAEGSTGNDDIARLKSGEKTSDGIGMQDIRLMAGEGKLTKQTVLQALAVIRKQRSVTEGSNGEYDDEAGMSETNLHTIARAAQGLLDTIDDNENLPEWVQEKIAKVEGMMVTAWDYLKSQEEQGVDPRQGVAGKGSQLEETYHDDDEFFEAYGIMEYNDEMINESEYQGRKVTLNKPMSGDVKKFKVYVKNEKGNVVKVNFGQKGARIKKNNPGRRKNFRARHNCDNPGPKTGARYWSCRKW